MATIQDAIALSDGVSPTLERIIRCSENMADTFQAASIVAGSMASAVDNAASRCQPRLMAMDSAAEMVAQSVESVNDAASRMNVGAGVMQMAGQFGAAESSIAMAAAGLERVRAEASIAAAGVNELSAACNQIHAPPEAAASVKAVGTAAERAVARTKEEIGEISAFAMQAAQQIMQMGVACDKIKVPAGTTVELTLVGSKAAEAAEKAADIGHEAQMATQRTNELANAARRLPDAFGDASRAAEGVNENIGRSGGILNGFRDALSGTIGKLTLAGVAAMGFAKVVESISQAPAKLAKLSDEYSGIMARINLVTGSQKQAAALNDRIYYSALRARGSYASMADTVSKIAMTAKEAFPDPRQVVPFVEGVQKLFAIGGTDPVRQKDAMLQLTQALGSGKLQGDEFRSIAEAAPIIEQMVAQYMGVSQGALKQLSSEGAITAEIMKNAILGSLGEIDAKMSTIPLKWSDIWQSIETQGYRAFTPVFEQVSRLANTPIVQKLAGGVVVGMQIAAMAVLGLMNNIEWLAGVAQETGAYIGSWLSAGFTILMPVFETLAALALSFFIVYAAGWVTAQMPLVAHIALLGVKAMWDAILIGYAWMQNAAMIAQNATLLISYIRLGLITAATAAWALVTQGVTAALRILNLTMFMNPIGIVIALVAAIIIAFGAWAVKTHGLRNTIADVFEGIVDICQTGVNIMIRAINGLLTVINKAGEGLNGLFGTSIGQVEVLKEVSFQGFKDKKGKELRAGEYGKFFGLDDILPKVPNAEETPMSIIPSYDELAQSGKETADNTKGMKEAMDITDEDIKYMRDAAEQEAIHKYTTAEIKIDMGGVQQNISSNVDLDGVVDHWVGQLKENMAAGAEAVHT